MLENKEWLKRVYGHFERNHGLRYTCKLIIDTSVFRPESKQIHDKEYYVVHI